MDRRTKYFRQRDPDKAIHTFALSAMTDFAARGVDGPKRRASCTGTASTISLLAHFPFVVATSQKYKSLADLVASSRTLPLTCGSVGAPVI
jgi:hypothetical protein